MGNSSFFDSAMFVWVIMPFLIVLARICDVAIGTIRIISIGRGEKLFAPLLGFFEVLIWLIAIKQIMQNLTNVLYYFAYAGGFALGNFIGMYIEEKLAMGILLIRIITRRDASALIGFLRSSGYGVTSVDAHGISGRVDLVYTIIKRNALNEVVEIIKRFNPKAFYSIEDIKSVSRGSFPRGRPYGKMRLANLLRFRRKGK